MLGRYATLERKDRIAKNYLVAGIQRGLTPDLDVVHKGAISAAQVAQEIAIPPRLDFSMDTRYRVIGDLHRTLRAAPDAGHLPTQMVPPPVCSQQVGSGRHHRRPGIGRRSGRCGHDRWRRNRPTAGTAESRSGTHIGTAVGTGLLHHLASMFLQVKRTRRREQLSVLRDLVSLAFHTVRLMVPRKL